MKTLVIYDSAYGNTEKIARSIGGAINSDVEVLQIGKLNPSALEPIDILFIGSPTQSGRPTPAMRDFLNHVPAAAIQKTSVAAFDTRFSGKLVSIFGYAAGKIAENLKSKGANLASSPEGFIVKGKEGPLKQGEVERAAIWAKENIESLSAAKC